MKPMTRTLTYVGVAIVSVSLAAWKGLPTPEINPQDFANVGEKFFPDFEDPNAATGARVVVFNPETAERKSFEVKYEGGEWIIPSHYNYPADGKDQLTRTAASLVAVRRGAVAGESDVDFERLGVVDPLLDDSSKLRGRGERLTLTRDSSILLDLIIGNKVEGREGFYYVRKPDERLTYIAELELELTTKFSDWIEPDLLQINTTDLRELVIKDYYVDEASRRIVMRDVLELSRPDASTPWILAKLDEQQEELKTAEINSMITALDELKIIGVRPKPPGVSADLKLSGEVQTRDISLLDLQAKGYYVVPTQQGLELFANEGDLQVGTDQGVQYTLRFGEVFTGSEFDIEVGSAQATTATDAADTDSEADQEAETESTDKPDSGFKQSRYLFVTVAFNEEILGPPPVKPTKPAEAPESDSTEPEKSPETPTDSDSPESPETPETPEDSTETPAASETPEATETPESETPAAEKEEAEATPEEPKLSYEELLQQYEQDLADYERRVQAGQQRVAELNARFADWYYVIDAASFDKLHKRREDLVQEKKAEVDVESPAVQPQLNLPGTDPQPETPTPETEPKSETEPKPEPEPKSEPEPESKSEPEPKTEPESTPTPEPSPEPTPEP